MIRDARVGIIGDGGDCTVSASGSLDFTNIQDLATALGGAAETAESLTIDLREVEFIDSAALDEIASACRTLMGRDRRLRVLVAANGQVDRVVTIAGFARVMDIVTDAARDGGV